MTLRRSRRGRSRRNGSPFAAFTLLEIVLALGIFFGSLAMLSQVTWNGTRAAVQSRMKALALLRCESKLQEIVAGVEALSDQSNVPFEDDSSWTWSVAIGQTSFPELLAVEVTVTRQSDSSLGSVSQSLSRWLRDPNVFIEAAEQEALLESEQTSSSSSSGTTP